MTACPNCKADNPDGSSFCQNCGKPLAGQATGTGPIDLSSAQHHIRGRDQAARVPSGRR